MRLFCLFVQCRWQYFGNVAITNSYRSFDAIDYHLSGLYQCSRCKSLSLGTPTDPAKRSGQSESLNAD